MTGPKLHPVEALAAGKDVLNLGCGRKPVDGALNVDANPAIGADLVFDLNRLPWPLRDDEFREVLAYDVIEHLDDVVAVMEEIHRVSRPGAVVRITVPHFSSANAYTDVTHRHHFSSQSFRYFTGEHALSYYSRVRFRSRHASLVFLPGLLNKVVWRLARRFPEAYERRFAWMFPAWFLYVELEVLKSAEGHAATAGSLARGSPGDAGSGSDRAD